MSFLRTYSELMQFGTLEERFRYLALRGSVGMETFGHERWMNQEFYTSRQWRNVRPYVIARDSACDLGILNYPIHDGDVLQVHHMNPMTASDLIHGEEAILDPEFLITTRLRTHNAIHYGDERQLPRLPVERVPGDTLFWRN